MKDEAQAAKERAGKVEKALKVIEGLRNLQQVSFQFYVPSSTSFKIDDLMIAYFKDREDGEPVENMIFRFNEDPAVMDWEPKKVKRRINFF